MKKILLTIAALTLVAAGCNKAISPQPVSNEPGNPVNVDPKWRPYGISFDSPSNWELRFTAPDDAARDKALKDGYENISLQEVITVTDSAEHLVMDFYRVHTTLENRPIEEQLTKYPCPGDATPCKGLTTLNGLKYKTYISRPGNEGLYHTVVILPTGKYIYYIYNTGQPTLDQELNPDKPYKSYMDQFWQVIDSIKLEQ